MSKNIVPFGKYKDQPIEALAEDRPYLEWMLAQSWFKSKYPDLFTIVINNFQEPADTPEHNAMHMKFLDDSYVVDLLLPLVGFSVGSVYQKRFECDGWDVFIAMANRSPEEMENLIKENRALSEAYNNCNGSALQAEIDAKTKKLWEGFDKKAVYLELKPTVSDDFPAVMRQIKSMKRANGYGCSASFSVLVVGAYTGIGATKEQFIQFMANENIHVIFAE